MDKGGERKRQTLFYSLTIVRFMPRGVLEPSELADQNQLLWIGQGSAISIQSPVWGRQGLRCSTANLPFGTKKLSLD